MNPFVTVGSWIKAIFVFLLIVGFVLGYWKAFGDGVPITDPAWFGRASANVAEWIGTVGPWFGNAVAQFLANAS